MTHTSIRTDAPPESYTPPKVVPVSARAEARIARLQMLLVQSNAVGEYERGQEDLGVVAARHGVTRRVFAGWVHAHHNRRDGPAPQTAAGQLEAASERDWETGSRNYGGMHAGMGGRMCDRDVRAATEKLGLAIVALQGRLGMRPFTYRTEAVL